jgi:hypothetical protein
MNSKWGEPHIGGDWGEEWGWERFVWVALGYN